MSETKNKNQKNDDLPDDFDITPFVNPENMEELPRTPFWRTLWKAAGPYRIQLFIAAICSMAVGIAVPLQMQFTVKWVIDSTTEAASANNGDLAEAEKHMFRAMAFVGLFIFLSFFRITVWIIGYRRALASIEWVLCQLRVSFFRHVQRLCFRFHDQVSSGELFNYIMGSPINMIKQFLQQFCMTVPYQVVGWFFSVGLLASFNWRMTVITVLAVVAVVFLNYRSRRIIREVSSDFMKTESDASRFIADMLRGRRAVKTYAMEDRVNDIFSYQAGEIRDRSYNLAKRQQIEFVKPEGVQYIGLALILLAGAYFMVYENMTTGTFTAFVLSFNMLMQPLLQVLRLNLIRANAETGLDRIMRVMKVGMTTPEKGPSEQVDPNRQAELTKGSSEAGIIFDNVRFSYQQENQAPVLEDCYCEISENESVALVGPSGSGKTTFISLLLRFYDPQKGEILLNNVDLRDYGLRELRAQFGAVPQDPFIFQATLKDNLCVTNSEASEEDIKHAMEMACMNDFVEELPEGINTWLGESGANLSGGQRQRLAIARAILAKPRYFIFDEATSALDNVSELRIQTAMEGLMRNHTSLIIAHRLSTIRNVDRILVFKKGRIVQRGTYNELAGVKGPFSEMLDSVKEKNLK